MSLTYDAIPTFRLLITDRDPASREALLHLLRAKGSFEFIGVAPPEAAIKQTALYRVNVVLLDIAKPYEMSVQICKGLRALAPSAIVVAITTIADPEEEKAMLAAGAAGYLEKEIRLEKLIHAIYQIVTRERAILDRSLNTRQF